MDNSIRKKQHNFKMDSVRGDKNLWRCDDCNSEALFSKGFSQLEANQIMMLRLPCLVPEFLKN